MCSTLSSSESHFYLKQKQNKTKTKTKQPPPEIVSVRKSILCCFLLAALYLAWLPTCLCPGPSWATWSTGLQFFPSLRGPFPSLVSSSCAVSFSESAWLAVVVTQLIRHRSRYCFIGTWNCGQYQYQSIVTLCNVRGVSSDQWALYTQS